MNTLGLRLHLQGLNSTSRYPNKDGAMGSHRVTVTWVTEESLGLTADPAAHPHWFLGWEAACGTGEMAAIVSSFDLEKHG